jgi:hypothetical protein
VQQVHLHLALPVPQHSEPVLSVLLNPQAVVSALVLQAPQAHSEQPQPLPSVQQHQHQHLEPLHLPLEARLQDLASLRPPLGPPRQPPPLHLAKPVPLELLNLLPQGLEHLQVQVHLGHQLVVVVALVLLLGAKLRKQTHPVPALVVQCTTTLSHACQSTLRRV